MRSRLPKAAMTTPLIPAGKVHRLDAGNQRYSVGIETHRTRTLARKRFRERFPRSGRPLFGIAGSVAPGPLETLRLRDLLPVAGSLKRGWVTASLLIGKLQSYPRKNRLTRALQEY
jgi:Tn3 transposase DDE domain-containing protein